MFENLYRLRDKLLLIFKNHLVTLSKRRSRAGLYEFLKSEFSIIPCGMKVLTVGAGGDINDLLMKYAKNNGFDVISFDIDKNRMPDILGDICCDKIATSSYDVVVICEVLEHLHSPRSALDNLYDSLKEGGKIILSAPFCLPIHDKPHDYFRFTRHGIELLLSKFNSVLVCERNKYFESIDVLWMRTVIEDKTKVKTITLLILLITYYIKRPITVMLCNINPLNSITTGYIATAIK